MGISLNLLRPQSFKVKLITIESNKKGSQKKGAKSKWGLTTEKREKRENRENRETSREVKRTNLCKSRTDIRSDDEFHTFHLGLNEYKFEMFFFGSLKIRLKCVNHLLLFIHQGRHVSE